MVQITAGPPVRPVQVAASSAWLPMSDHLWLTTAELCSHLAISRSTLFAIRRSGLLKDGRPWWQRTRPVPARTCSGAGSAVN
jgi:hypothetical protein